MGNRIVVYYDRLDLWNGKIKTKMLEIDKELPKNCFYTEDEARDSYNKKLAIIKADYEKHKPIANAKLDKLESDIKALLDSSDCDLYFTYEGDAHGIYDDRMEISATINGHKYTKQIEF